MEADRWASDLTSASSPSLADVLFTGYCGLGRAVSSLGLRTSVPIELDFIVSPLPVLAAEAMTLLTSINSAPPSGR